VLYRLGDIKYELLELYNCNNKKELLEREAYYIKQNYNLVVNKNKPTLSEEEKIEWQKEYYAKNKKTKIENSKEYYEKNKQYYKERYQKNKQQINEYKKEYYEKNRERICQQQKEYRDKNKERISEQLLAKPKVLEGKASLFLELHKKYRVRKAEKKAILI